MNNNQIKHIQQPVSKELALFHKSFKESMKSKVPLLNKITYFLVQRKGKQMRPLFVLLSAKMVGDITQSTYNAASLIELMHTATLVHDDVVDDAHKRRGFFSINALWKNKIAVLVGDYLLSRSLILAIENNEFKQLHNLSTAVKAMSEGELLQIEKARKLDITEDVYFEIITAKTASLIEAACRAGALSATTDENTINLVGEIGRLVGIAFQIKDDLFDYGQSDVGKPVGIDVKEKKMTLPLIYALNNTEKRTKRKMISIVKNKSEDKQSVKELVDWVRQEGGIAYANAVMLEYRDKAITLLSNLPDSEAKEAFVKLVNFTIERKR